MEKQVGSADQREAEGKILTLYEAADKLRTSYSTVYRLVMDGELEAFKLRFGWRTSEAACDAYVKKRFAERAATCKAIEVE